MNVHVDYICVFLRIHLEVTFDEQTNLNLQSLSVFLLCVSLCLSIDIFPHFYILFTCLKKIQLLGHDFKNKKNKIFSDIRWQTYLDRIWGCFIGRLQRRGGRDRELRLELRIRRQRKREREEDRGLN